MILFLPQLSLYVSVLAPWPCQVGFEVNFSSVVRWGGPRRRNYGCISLETRPNDKPSNSSFSLHKP